MNFPSKETVERMRNEYPPGTRVELLEMDDPQAPAIGTKGTVRYVDDAGQIGEAWDTGSSLAVIPGVDRVRILDMKVCPLCGKEYSEPPALSRKDNVTLICPSCGVREALKSIGVEEKEQDEIIGIIQSYE